MNKASIHEYNALHRFKTAEVVTKIFFLLILFLGSFSLQAQTTESARGIDKSKLTLKPNSRDVNVSYRGNSMQRVQKIRKPDMLVKHHIKNKKLEKRNADPAKRQQMIQRRKQLIQQRSALRK
jgi:hypothetical protein